MRLADFILRDMKHILGEWEAFVATQLPAARNLDSLALRDPRTADLPSHCQRS